MREQPMFLLPPRPRRRDWVASGLSAGAMLALMELVVALPGGLSPPPEVALLLVASATLCVAAIGTLVGCCLEAAGVRLSHSGMLGAMLGPLIGAGVPGAIWMQAEVSAPYMLGLSGIAAVALFASAAGLAGARLCDALESGGISVSGPLIWGAAALCTGSGARILVEQPIGRELAMLFIAPAMALLWIVVGHERARRRGRGGVVQQTRILGWACTAAIGAALYPWIAPWVFYGDNMPELTGSPMNVIVVAVDDSAGASGQATLDWIAWNGVRYDKILPEPPTSRLGSVANRGGVEALLRTGSGTALGTELMHNGYVTHAIVAQEHPHYGLENGLESVDARPGPRDLLDRQLSWMAGSALLRGPGAALLDALGLSSVLRTPAQIIDSANLWLVSWRSTKAPSPFFLMIDLRTPRGIADPAEADIALSELLQQLEMIGVANRTAILVALESADKHGQLDGPGGIQAALRLPPMIDPELRDVRSSHPIRGNQLGDALLEMTRVDLGTLGTPGSPRPRLPGVTARPGASIFPSSATIRSSALNASLNPSQPETESLDGIAVPHMATRSHRQSRWLGRLPNPLRSNRA